MADDGGSGSRFIVDLGEIRFPSLLETRVDAEIKAVVLRALAENASSSQRLPQLSIWDEFPGQTLGLWTGDPNNPPIILGSGASPPLTVRDHTLIMKAIMENPAQVLRYLPGKYKSKGGNPPGKEVLQAALQVEQIESDVKDRIRAVLEILPKVEEAQANAPVAFKQAVDGLRQQLTNKTVGERLDLLRDARLRNTLRDDGLADGMEFAAQILEDGQSSIYSPDHGFYKLIERERVVTHGQGGDGWHYIECRYDRRDRGRRCWSPRRRSRRRARRRGRGSWGIGWRRPWGAGKVAFLTRTVGANAPSGSTRTLYKSGPSSGLERGRSGDEPRTAMSSGSLVTLSGGRHRELSQLSPARLAVCPLAFTQAPAGV